MKSILSTFIVGIFFAVLQMSYFFSLQTLLTSTILSYFSIVFCWLVGAIIGLKFFEFVGERVILVSSIVAYYLFLIILCFNKFNTMLLPIYVVLIIISSIYAGYFFPFQSKFFKKINYLFLIENNGFVFGILLAYIFFMFYGINFLIFVPGIVFLVLLMIKSCTNVK
jgi:hypothetical protein